MKQEEKAAAYRHVIEVIRSIIANEKDAIAVMATISCELHHRFGYFHWTGFYRNVDGVLVIGPYQGNHGCLRIPAGKGVCGEVFLSGQTQIVADVSLHPNHIACSSTTRSEIVVPIKNHVNEVMLVLDIDSNEPAAFDQIDQTYLESVAHLVTSSILF